MLFRSTVSLGVPVPPIVLRLWAQPGRVTVTVKDSGPGPIDSFIGLAGTGTPSDTVDDRAGEPALGLWLIQQLVEVTRRSDPSGYTLRLTAAQQSTSVSD